MRNLPYGKQFIDAQDVKLVVKSLKQKLITSGNYVKKFEKRVSTFLKTKYSISCNSGTSALHLALLSINVKKDDAVIVSSITFVAAINMLKNLGAKIYLADVDINSGQITTTTVKECIKFNKIKKVKCIITTYLGGHVNEIEEFYKLKKKLKCFLIEDACHALGTKYFIKKKKYSIGSCKHSDISTFSLHPLKTITSGEGGLITTNNRKIYNKILLLRSHGILRSKKHFKYNVIVQGFNYRLSDINCALALSQIKKIPMFLTKRKAIAENYNKLLKNQEKLVTCPKLIDNLLSSWHLYQVRIDFKKINSSKNNLIKNLLKKKIITQIHYIPIYNHEVYKNLKRKIHKNSKIFYDQTLSLPIFIGLKYSEQKYIVKSLVEILT